MKAFIAPSSMNKGFTLVEVLVGLFALSFCMLLLIQTAVVINAYPKELYEVEDGIGIRQLQLITAQSDHIKVSPQELQMNYHQSDIRMSLHHQRLVKQPGYEIFLKDLAQLSFYEEGGCVYVTWTRTNQKKAILGCE